MHAANAALRVVAAPAHLAVVSKIYSNRWHPLYVNSRIDQRTIVTHGRSHHRKRVSCSSGELRRNRHRAVQIFMLPGCTEARRHLDLADCSGVGHAHTQVGPKRVSTPGVDLQWRKRPAFAVSTDIHIGVLQRCNGAKAKPATV